MEAASWALVLATFLACFVEMVEATTIVMAMGYTRSWRSSLLGVVAALMVLVVVTVAFGYALATWLPESALQLVIGGLLLVFGLQWLRKAILRSAGCKTVHDQEAIFREEVEAARGAGGSVTGFDLFAFMVSFKGVFLEGMEVVFIVITFGLNADDVPTAAVGAGLAVASVLGLAVLLRRPLSMINENLLKYAVGLLLAAFGTFWVVEGVGVFRPDRESLEWFGHDLALVALVAIWFVVSRILVAALRRPGRGTPGDGAPVRLVSPEPNQPVPEA